MAERKPRATREESLNAKIAVNLAAQAKLVEKLDALKAGEADLKGKLDDLHDLSLKRRRIREIEEYIGSLKELGYMEFSEALWCSMVQRVDVSNSDMTFTMADGSVIKEEIA
jgi:hypothetical protein